MKNQGLPVRERGSVVVWIFVMIALLGALTFALTRGSRTSLGNLDREKSDLAASEIIGYAQSAREAVRMLKIKGCSDTYINFAAPGNSYGNLLAPTDQSCDVFKGTGGGITFAVTEKIWFDVNNAGSPTYGKWQFTGASHVLGIGTAGNAGAGCVDGSSNCKELIMFLPYLNRNICQAINRRLGFGGTNGAPPIDSGNSLGAAFAGTYDPAGVEMGTATPANYSGQYAGCFQYGSATGAYFFYQVLLAR